MNNCPRCGLIQGLHFSTLPGCKCQWQMQSNVDKEQPKPFGYFLYDIRLDAWVQNRAADKGIPFYTHPREWVGLTDEEIATISVECATVSPSDIYFARVIEAKLKERNS